MINYLVIFIFLRGLVVFVSKFKHFLLILMGLEFIVLSIFFGIFLYLSLLRTDYYLVLIYLVIRVSEGALALRVLVSLIRRHGNDYIIRFSSLW